MISGAGGGLGHLAVQFSARGIGHRVIGVDHSSKKDIVMESGAEHFIAVDGEQDVVEAVQALTNGLGAHAVVVCTANNAAYAQSAEMLRFGGRVVCVGIPEGEVVPIKSSYPGLLVAKSLQIVGSAVGSRKEAIEVSSVVGLGWRQCCMGMVMLTLTIRRWNSLPEALLRHILGPRRWRS